MRRSAILVAVGTLSLVLSVGTADAVTASRTVSVRDAAFPNDTTYSFSNPYTSAKTPTGNHLDLAKVTATYDPTTKALMVDWVMWTPITTSNCPNFHNGARCDVTLNLWPVDPATGTVNLLAGVSYEFTGVPFGTLADQYVRSCYAGDCPPDQTPAARAETFGHHHVVWFSVKNWRPVRLRLGSETTAGTFTSAGAGNLNDPYWIDSKHQMATLIDWTDAQNVPDLQIG